jgi:carboxypeptidase C (cathepsin A)
MAADDFDSSIFQSENLFEKTNHKIITEELYSAIVQWQKLFPEFKSNPFFVFGESYGAKLAILIAKKIQMENTLMERMSNQQVGFLILIPILHLLIVIDMFIL